MKSLNYIIFLIAFIMMSCDQPRDRRTAYKAKDLQENSSYNYNYGDDGNGNGNGNGNGTPTPTATAGGQTIPPEISHCSWSSDGVNGFTSTHPHIGAHTLCQETGAGNDTKVHIQVQSPVTDSQVCVIPTYHSNNRAIYIGEPRCLLLSSNLSIYPITLLKNRTGYSQFQITGVMVMKDKAFFYPSPFYRYILSPDAFLFCSQWLDQYGDNSYCYAFDSVGQYVYHQF